MKNSSLLTKSIQVYKLIEQQIEKVILETDERKWIEQAFGLAMKSWLDIEETANNYRFLHRDEEIYFYKILKPKFIGLIEYFTLLYKSILFQPDDSIKRDAFWKHELESCRDLIFIYNAGCQYYEKLANPEIYFLEQSNQQPLLFGLNVTRINITDTSYSYLRGRLIAMKKYEKYIQFKLYENIGSMEYPLFFEHLSSAN